ncbi:MAG: hypothetical protein KJ666_05810 [Bacteroidetes bacterium]|nr:hypothetical protein [Bacteroidota bacterium]
MKRLILVLVIPFLSFIPGQIQDEKEDIQIAFTSAMKGVYWAQENVSPKRETMFKDIIVNNKKICTVKIYKQVGGLKIISEGYEGSTKVEITTYRSTSEK